MGARTLSGWEDFERLEKMEEVLDPGLARLIRAYRMVHLIFSPDDRQRLVVARCQWPNLDTLLRRLDDEMRTVQQTAQQVQDEMETCEVVIAPADADPAQADRRLARPASGLI